MQQACNSDAIDSEAQPEPEAGSEIDAETQATLDKCAVPSSNSAFASFQESSQIQNFGLKRPQSSQGISDFAFATRPSTKAPLQKDAPVLQSSIRLDIAVPSVELAENSALQQGMRIQET
jgi:hypothetical protein